jgi:hypothetical protein
MRATCRSGPIVIVSSPSLRPSGATQPQGGVRPALPRPVQTGGWEAKAAGDFGEQQTPRSPRTLCIHIGAMIAHLVPNINSDPSRYWGVGITLWREMLRQAQHRLVTNPSASSASEAGGQPGWDSTRPNRVESHGYSRDSGAAAH